LTSLISHYSAEGLDYKFQYSSERLGIDPEKVKTADVADFTLLREVQRELGSIVAAATSANRAGDDRESVRDGMLNKSI
jgi:hypothetical protein